MVQLACNYSMQINYATARIMTKKLAQQSILPLAGKTSQVADAVDFSCLTLLLWSHCTCVETVSQWLAVWCR